MSGELFERLRAAAGAVWPAYTRHDFVLLLAKGELPEAAFRRYLVQDYLFLLHFARAWGLAIYKSEKLAEMRRPRARGCVCARRAVPAARRRGPPDCVSGVIHHRRQARSRFLANGS